MAWYHLLLAQKRGAIGWNRDQARKSFVARSKLEGATSIDTMALVDEESSIENWGSSSGRGKGGGRDFDEAPLR